MKLIVGTLDETDFRYIKLILDILDEIDTGYRYSDYINAYLILDIHIHEIIKNKYILKHKYE